MLCLLGSTPTQGFRGGYNPSKWKREEKTFICTKKTNGLPEIIGRGNIALPPPTKWGFRDGATSMKALTKILVLMGWSSSVVYLYAGPSLSGYGPQGDFRQLALAGLIISTGAMVDRSFTRLLVGFRRLLRGRSPLPECK